MFSLSFLSVSLTGASLILLLTAASEAQYFDATQLPDYDYNATFDYSFYSNASSEDLDKFSERFIDQEEREDEGTGGRQEEEEVTVTMVTTQRTTERGEDDVGSAASLPVCLEIRTLLWTLMILIGLNTHTL
ncbi:uncharacterized protein [Pempheris klunzingeri]|uniref:uncharacterized protein n=1 Tax=Pempheris klunzingeri TaxID=3127111 RepID=UPI00397F66B8